MEVTADLLRSIGSACQEHMTKFNRLFPSGLTRRAGILHASEFNWDWAASAMLGIEQKQTYLTQRNLAYRTYAVAISEAHKAYIIATAFAQPIYDRIDDGDDVSDDEKLGAIEAIDAAHRSYKAALKEPERNYNMAQATAFLDACDIESHEGATKGEDNGRQET